ncbi:unnamed protein product, partial [marine sediment metagenome]
KKTRLRAFDGYNVDDKNKLYKMGTRKGWGYHVRTKFRGRFSGKFPGGKKFLDAYNKKKRKAMESITKGLQEPDIVNKGLVQRNLLLKERYNELKSMEKVAKWSTKAGVPLTNQLLSQTFRGMAKEKDENLPISNPQI